MKLKLSIVAIILITISACKMQQTKADMTGFVSLFNGENWEGWYLKIRNNDADLANKVFQIENGMIHVFKEVPEGSEVANGKNPTHGLFYTDKAYSKYILKFEYKWGKNKANNYPMFQYDAGLYYHVIDDAIWPKGIEYQVRYNPEIDKNHTGDYWGLAPYNWTSNENNEFAFIEDGGKPQPPRGMEHLASPTRNFNGLNDKWNQCEVIVMGSEYSIHKLNGEIVNMATNFVMDGGKIGFQSETAEIYYRNIMIKELKEFVPAETFLK
ncbi:3-keto-disaccharide hydrolase [Polaribacter glomeratus]|uniref:3-keto-alpha-glucoside-1,2-lyase/3-keto-2-hydroxy-glucal hydratase domain-containing protein n=1 Tax=Polaribacter glomeratus TaxID=102 RepID=A0A2S7WG52_9FLAO|nr:DUF1080 domain-containing protein [Polaribacter glomeratus]PQJ76599.1 hypothetical protein BTO16_11950 [Polaribacter glomeratus]TXD67562.1 DUF1080 domain-containing protein [Polaribacter glomeratus]